MNTKYLLVYNVDGIKYFHIASPSKNGEIELYRDGFRTVAHATTVVRFTDGKSPEIIKDRGWSDMSVLKHIDSIEHYIQIYNLRCGYFLNGKLVYKGSTCSNPCDLFQEIKSIFGDPIYD
ncbi:hypothetical protein XaC1_148 [Xanthomonas phage XaC1]|nr:hypothetical protein XaC1_148 [Xanthomonas phage XaC1]